MKTGNIRKLTLRARAFLKGMVSDVSGKRPEGFCFPGTADTENWPAGNSFLPAGELPPGISSWNDPV